MVSRSEKEARQQQNPPERITPRDPRQPADFDPIALGRHLLRNARAGALGTLDGAGFPLVTLVSVATDHAGAPILLVSGLSAHTRNLEADSRCSLLLSQPGKGDPLAHPRLTLLGHARKVEAAEACARLRRRFLSRHPKAQLYVDFPDFSILTLAPERIHINGGFARAYDGDGAGILSPVPDEAAFEALEHAIIPRLNETQSANLALYAEKLCNKTGRGWRATGLDPHGLDVMKGDDSARFAFQVPVFTTDAVEAALAELDKRAQNGVRA
jgi:heme iron utilization protein